MADVRRVLPSETFKCHEPILRITLKLPEDQWQHSCAPCDDPLVDGVTELMLGIGEHGRVEVPTADKLDEVGLEVSGGKLVN